jgi:hypothetical protein
MEKTIQVAVRFRILQIENALERGSWKDKADAYWNIMNLQQFLDKTETT